MADKFYLSNPATLANAPSIPPIVPKIAALSAVESLQRLAAARANMQGFRLNQSKLNAVYSSLDMKRRYEVWFLRCGLADGSGAWWFRYLIVNPGIPRVGLASAEMPVQAWATWFPAGGQPRTFIQGFPIKSLHWSPRKEIPFHCRIAGNGIEQDFCWGNLAVDGHSISWKLAMHSNFGTVLSDKGWIGFSRSPHSDATFRGEIQFDGKTFHGEPLGFGVQGHNCGYRHRSYWRWMHAYFPHASGANTIEALEYDLPLGLKFRNVILQHEGKLARFAKLAEREVICQENLLRWTFAAVGKRGATIELTVEGLSPELHRLPYFKTDGSGTFQVSNASLANAVLKLPDGQCLESKGGAVLEFGGI